MGFINQSYRCEKTHEIISFIDLNIPLKLSSFLSLPEGAKAMNLEKCIISDDDKLLYTINRSSIVRFDLEKDNYETVLENETYLKEVLVRSDNDLVTLDGDNGLRIWDLRRAAHPQNITVVRDVEYRTM